MSVRNVSIKISQHQPDPQKMKQQKLTEEFSDNSVCILLFDVAQFLDSYGARLSSELTRNDAPEVVYK